MYWNPFDSAHSGRINSSSGWAAILGFILAGRLWVVGFFFLKAAGRTRVQGVITLRIFSSSPCRVVPWSAAPVLKPSQTPETKPKMKFLLIFSILGTISSSGANEDVSGSGGGGGGGGGNASSCVAPSPVRTMRVSRRPLPALRMVMSIHHPATNLST
jgi:hypothetical protein